MKKVFSLLLILCFVPAVAGPVLGGDVTVLMSANVDASRKALQGLRETLRHRIISQHNIRENFDLGLQILAKIESTINPDLMFTVGRRALRVAARKRTDMPVVYAMVFNPLSIIRPGVKNITGVSMNVSPKQTMRLFKDLSPRIRRVGVIFNPANTGDLVRVAAQVAEKQKLELVTRQVRSSKQAIKAVDSLRDKIDGLWILPDETTLVDEVVEYMLLFSYWNKIPVLGLSDRQVRMGAALSLSYGSSRDIGRQAGEMANSILKGTRPARIPHTTPRQVRLTVNTRAARKLVMEIPTRILEKADNVIPQHDFVKAPIYEDGDWWVFRVKEEGKPAKEIRVTYKDGKFESDNPGFLTGEDFPGMPSFLPWASVYLNDPEKKWLDFPLLPGKQWSFRYPLYNYGPSIVSGSGATWGFADAEVIGPVALPVKTPAGSFNVIKIERADSTGHLTYFYSPETKSVVKLTADVITQRPQHYEMELIKYGHEAPAVGAPVVKVPGVRGPVKVDWSAVKAPIYEDGDWWVFRVKEEGKPAEEIRVTYKDGNFESDNPAFLRGEDFPGRPSFLPWASVYLNDPEKKWLDFPLLPGKQWSFRYPRYSYSLHMSQDDAAGGFADARVIGPVALPVKTPAGSFNVIKIERADCRSNVNMSG